MSDDIVTRLRKYLSHIDEYELTPLAYEAADEIERLRKIIVELKGSEMCDPNDPCEMCKE